MIHNDQPVDIIVGSGETQTVCEFCEKVFPYPDLDYHDYVVQEPRFILPADVDLVVANPTRDHQSPGWVSRVDFCG
jgi:GDPmannose 4,6-dehydratase